MTLQIHNYVLGPIQNNTYLAVDVDSKQAALIDPAIPSRQIADFLEQHQLRLSFILITHAHFDHIGGVRWFRALGSQKPPVALHALDLELWRGGGGSKDFGFELNAGEEPDLMVADGQEIEMGKSIFKVLHTPGHSFGHVTYYNAESRAAFCGDLIFHHSVGRTDLPVSSEADLYSSIREKILTLPEDTILYPGHGEKTSVGEEKANNPF